MATGKRRRTQTAPVLARAPVPSAAGGADEGLAALEEIQRLLDAPLAELMGTPEEQAEAEELSRQASAAPAMARLRDVVAFVGKGRPATQAGNLKSTDALALAQLLAPGEQLPGDVRSMADLPETPTSSAGPRRPSSWPGVVPGLCPDHWPPTWSATRWPRG